MAPIHNAARNGNLNRVKTLLNRGVPVNTQTDAGWTPLHFAAYSGRVNVVQELLRRGAHLPPNLNAQVRRILELPPNNMEAIRLERDLRRAIESGASNSVISRAYVHAANHGFRYPFANNLMERGRRAFYSIRDPARREEREREEREMEERDMRERRERREAGARVNTAGRTVTRDAAAVRAPNYSKASKHLKKWLEARPHEIRVNQVNVKLPEGASDPISLKNFNKGNEAIMVLKKDVRNGALRTKRYFLEKNVLTRLAKKPWRSILRMKASDAVFKDPINRRTVYRRNLMNMKFI